MNTQATVSAQPNLALVKYWGKKNRGINVPATSSIGLTLNGIETRTTLTLMDRGTGGPRIKVNGTELQDSRFEVFFRQAEKLFSPRLRQTGISFSDIIEKLAVDSTNNFPTAAGLASSSSGLGALAFGLDALLETRLERSALSALARSGSGSAARTLYGGFVEFREGSTRARQLAGNDHWPEFRVVVFTVSAQAKKTSSRAGMNAIKKSSPCFPAWVRDSRSLFKEMRSAVLDRDIEKTGTIARLSYLRMFATMFAANPPLVYWQPESIEIIHALEDLRSQGIAVWETMDAGPQVKALCEEKDLADVLAAFHNRESRPIILSAGKGPEVIETWK